MRVLKRVYTEQLLDYNTAYVVRLEAHTDQQEVLIHTCRIEGLENVGDLRDVPEAAIKNSHILLDRWLARKLAEEAES